MCPSFIVCMAQCYLLDQVSLLMIVRHSTAPKQIGDTKLCKSLSWFVMMSEDL